MKTLLAFLATMALLSLSASAQMLKGQTPYNHSIVLSHGGQTNFNISYANYANQEACEADLWAVGGEAGDPGGIYAFVELIVGNCLEVGDYTSLFGGVVYHFIAGTGAKFAGGQVVVYLNNQQWAQPPVVRFGTTTNAPTPFGGAPGIWEQIKWTNDAYSVFLFDNPGQGIGVTATSTVPGTVSAPVTEFWVVLEKAAGSSANGYAYYLHVEPNLLIIPPIGTIIKFN